MKFKRRNHELSPPYVSMADIAFNLVLFFLIMARVKSNDHIEWKPAEVKGTAKAANTANMVATGYKKGDENKVMKVFLNGEEIGMTALASKLEATLAGEGKDRTVLLKIHEDTLAATFQKIMEAVSQAGGEVFHVLKEEQ